MIIFEIEEINELMNKIVLKVISKTEMFLPSVEFPIVS